MALISDAGTPGISDPGMDLVRKIVFSALKVVSSSCFCCCSSLNSSFSLINDFSPPFIIWWLIGHPHCCEQSYFSCLISLHWMISWYSPEEVIQSLISFRWFAYPLLADSVYRFFYLCSIDRFACMPLACIGLLAWTFLDVQLFSVLCYNYMGMIVPKSYFTQLSHKLSRIYL